MTDLELIEYANKAGLCLATCWDLDELYNANAAEETERWIRDSQTANEREEKQAVANTMRLTSSGQNEQPQAIRRTNLGSRAEP
jgi:hypothetical protein